MPYIFALLSLLLIGCDFQAPFAVERQGMYTETDQSKVSTRYVHEAYTGLSCWEYTGSPYETVTVDGLGYPVSNKSRYRAVMLPSAMIDVLIEGPVYAGDWSFFQDVTSGITYVFNNCSDHREG